MEKIEKSFTRWKEVSTILEELFQKRNRIDAKTYMVESVTLYNNLSEKIKEVFHLQSLKLLNEGERLQFIHDNVDHYHSFIQLKELFVELEKGYYKLKLIKKSDA